MKDGAKTILLVEDNPSDIGLTQRALEKTGMGSHLVVAEDGQEALNYLWGTGALAGREGTELPALVLLDLKLSKVPGLEVLRRIRADWRTRRLPVVILSTSQEEADIAAGYDLCVNGYVRKPIDFKRFAAAIEQIEQYWLLLNEAPPKVR